MKYNTLRIERNEKYTVAWLSRPEKRNALNLEMINELIYFFNHYIEENDIKIVVIAGKGNTFCSGADLNDFAADNHTPFIDAISYLFSTIYRSQAIVVSVAHGKVFGGGLGLLSVSDIVIADTNSSFCFSEVKLGLVPAMISPYLENKVTNGMLRYLMLSAIEFDIKTAKDIGLVHQITQFGEKPNIQHLIENITKNNTAAMREAKLLLNDISKYADFDDKTNHAKNFIKRILEKKETKEILKSFLKNSK